ncbi:MAG: hypothetical protein H7Z17_02305 [Fuerstia sp.]|nr:hypothetical protein [Fuerstiella sp.]
MICTVLYFQRNDGSGVLPQFLLHSFETQACWQIPKQSPKAITLSPG